MRLLIPALVLVPVIARADVALPPTGVFDVFYLGGTLGLAAAAILAFLAVASFRALRKRGRSRRLATFAAVGIVVAGNLAAYFYYMTVIRPEQRRAMYEHFRKTALPADGGS